MSRNGVAEFFAAGVTLFAAVGLIGCGAAFPGLPVTHTPADVRFEFWVPGPGGTYSGHLQNGGLAARNIRVEVWYADGVAESVQVVAPVPADLEELHGGWFTVSPQISNGESRYPRVGTISWDGGSSQGTPRKPAMGLHDSVCFFSPDSLVLFVVNNGGWAYHVSVTLEDLSGVHTITTLSDPLMPGSADVHCLPRDSLGVRLSPRVLLIRWEDYGGIPDSLVMPPVDTLLAGCG